MCVEMRSVLIMVHIRPKNCHSKATEYEDAARDQLCISGWGALRREVASSGAQSEAAPSLGWTGNIGSTRSPTPKMDFMDVAFQMIGTAKK